MSTIRRLGAHLPRSVTRSAQGVRAVLGIDEPLQVVRRLGSMPPRQRRLVGHLMRALSHAATPASRDHGRAALLRAVGSSAVDDGPEVSATLRHVADAADTPDRTRVDIGRLLLQRHDLAGARDVLDRMSELESDRNAERALLQARVDLSLARYPEAVLAARTAASLDPRRASAQAVLVQALAQERAHDPDWRPTVPDPPRPHAPRLGRPVILVSHGLPGRQSGYAIRTQNVAAAMLDLGLEPVVAARRQEDVAAGRHPPDAWQVGPVAYRLTTIARELRERPDHDAALLARGLADIAMGHEASVLHATSPWTDLRAALAVGERLGLPVVYEVRRFLQRPRRPGTSDDAGASHHDHVDAHLELTLMREAAAVVTVSDGLRHRLVERGVDPALIHVIPNAVEPDRFVPLPRDDALARQLGLGDGPVIGYVSTLAPNEGIEILIEATAELRRRGRGVRCLIVGDGPERGRLEQARRSSGMEEGSVVFSGRVAHADIGTWYSLLDVFVVPRRAVATPELATPLEPYEAMAMDIPVVVSRVDALRELVDEGVTGLSFRPGDPQDLADVLEPLLFDLDRRRALGHAAGAWVREHRTWRRSAERYLDLYRHLGVA